VGHQSLVAPKNAQLAYPEFFINQIFTCRQSLVNHMQHYASQAVFEEMLVIIHFQIQWETSHQSFIKAPR
jgi:hypothetical protein